MSSILVVVSHDSARTEGNAVARALIELGRHDVHFLGAGVAIGHSLPKSGLPTDRPLAQRSRIKEVVLKSLPLRALALLYGILVDRCRLRAVFSDLRPAMVVLFDDRRVRPD